MNYPKIATQFIHNVYINHAYPTVDHGSQYKTVIASDRRERSNPEYYNWIAHGRTAYALAMTAMPFSIGNLKRMIDKFIVL